MCDKCGHMKCCCVKVITKQGTRGKTGPRGLSVKGDPGEKGDSGLGYNATSVSSIDVLTNSATGGSWSMSTNKAYLAGDRVRISFDYQNYFEGTLSAYNPSTGTFTILNIDVKVGSGTHAAWNIGIAGIKGTSNIYINRSEISAPYTPSSDQQILTVPIPAGENGNYLAQTEATLKFNNLAAGTVVVKIKKNGTLVATDSVIVAATTGTIITKKSVIYFGLSGLVATDIITVTISSGIACSAESRSLTLTKVQNLTIS